MLKFLDEKDYFSLEPELWSVIERELATSRIKTLLTSRIRDFKLPRKLKSGLVSCLLSNLQVCIKNF